MSLDIENLFANVPVDQTIGIILNSIYTNNSIPPPSILKKLLHTCTTKVPFYDHNGNIYTQTNGVSMGNSLGPCFSNYYTSHVENTIFIQVHKPKIYIRYIDDIFILANNIKEIGTLKTTFEKNSVLNFTYELSQKKKKNDWEGKLMASKPCRLQHGPIKRHCTVLLLIVPERFNSEINKTVGLLFAISVAIFCTDSVFQ